MKRFEKIISLLTVMSIMCSLAACSDSDSNDEDETTAATTVTIIADTEPTEPTESAVDEPEIPESNDYAYNILGSMDAMSDGSLRVFVEMAEPCIFHDQETGLDLELTFYGTLTYFVGQISEEEGEELKEQLAQCLVNAFAETVDEIDDEFNFSQIDEALDTIQDHVSAKIMEELLIDSSLAIGEISLTPDSLSSYESAQL